MPFLEVLHKKKYKTPLCASQIEENLILDPDTLQ